MKNKKEKNKYQENKNENTSDQLDISKNDNPGNDIDNKDSMKLEDELDADIGVEEQLSDEKSQEEKLNEEIELLRDEKLRLLADMDNLRKRAEKDKIDYIRYGSINLARDILSPDDNLSRALDAITDVEQTSETNKNLIDGLKMVQKEFATILEKYGVKKIDALNKKFDHNFHQAVIEIDNDEVDSGIVIQEMQSGYTMYEKLLRPSMVGVSKKSQQNSEENGEENIKN